MSPASIATLHADERMTDQPESRRPGEPDHSLDDTQRIEMSRYTPPPAPRPDAGWGPPPPGVRSPEHWFEPADERSSSQGWSSQGEAAVPTTSTPDRSDQRRRDGIRMGPVVAASLLSAVLAAGGTVVVIDRTGALSRTAAVPSGSSTVNNQIPASSASSKAPGTVDESTAIINAASRVGPAVVKIEVQGNSSQIDPFGSVPVEGIGSGVIYDPNGWILTNKHVVAGSDKLTIELKDGRSFSGKVYGIDTLTDLAIVKVDQADLPSATLGSSDGLKIGQLVVAIGSPLGTYSFSVTSGIVSGTGRSIQVDSGERLNNLIQTDAAINPGNSGGPLIDASGTVVGVNTAVARNGNGIGFAIPIDIAKPIMDQAVHGETLARPYIGIRFVPIDPQLSSERHLPVSKGALLGTADGSNAVEPNSPAEAAGLKDGDIITAIEGISIDSEHPLEAVLTRFAAGKSVNVSILRDGKSMDVTVKLGTRPSQ